MSFVFQQKKEALNWDQISKANVHHLIQTTDIGTLEALLANITNAKLSKADFQKFGDKNLTKLFKVGQLSLEYLLFAQQYSESALSHAQGRYLADHAKCDTLQEEVRRDRQTVVNLRADCRLKYATLSSYEHMLKTPLGKAQVFKCQICFKYFKDHAFLQQHYERRHPQFFESERFKKQSILNQNQLETADLLQAQVQQREEFFERCKSELIDRYSSNFVELQAQLQDVSHTNAALLDQNTVMHRQIKEQVSEATYSVKEYQQMIEEFRQKVQIQVSMQKNEVQIAVKEAIELHKQQEAKLQDAKAQEELKQALLQKEKEFKIKENTRQEVTEKLNREFEKTLKFNQERVAERDRSLQQSQQTLKETKIQVEVQKALVTKLQQASQESQSKTQTQQKSLSSIEIQKGKELAELQMKLTDLEAKRSIDAQKMKQMETEKQQILLIQKTQATEYQHTMSKLKEETAEALREKVKQEQTRQEELLRAQKLTDQLQQEALRKESARLAEEKRLGDIKLKQDQKLGEELQVKTRLEQDAKQRAALEKKILDEQLLKKQKDFEQAKLIEQKADQERLKMAQVASTALTTSKAGQQVAKGVKGRSGPLEDDDGIEEEPKVLVSKVAPQTATTTLKKDETVKVSPVVVAQKKEETVKLPVTAVVSETKKEEEPPVPLKSDSVTKPADSSKGQPTTKTAEPVKTVADAPTDSEKTTAQQEDKSKITAVAGFTKVQVRNPTPTRVDDTPKIAGPPQESTRAVGLKKQISQTGKTEISTLGPQTILSGEQPTMDAQVQPSIDKTEKIVEKKPSTALTEDAKTLDTKDKSAFEIKPIAVEKAIKLITPAQSEKQDTLTRKESPKIVETPPASTATKVVVPPGLPTAPVKVAVEIIKPPVPAPTTAIASAPAVEDYDDDFD